MRTWENRRMNIQRQFPIGSLGEMYGTLGTRFLTIGEMHALGIQSGGPVARTPELERRLAELKPKRAN